MRVPVGGTSRLRSPLSFALSGCVHSCVLAWVVLSGPATHREGPRSIYDREIRPNERKIVWYSLREKLPEISPADAASDRRPPRAREKAPQTMVAGKTNDAQPAQLIWTPVPEAAPPKLAPLPNVIAVAPPPKLLRPFVAPPVQPPPAPPAPMLPEAPRVSAMVAVAAPGVALLAPGTGARPQPRAFTPPPEVRMQRQAALQLPEAPTVATVVEPNALPFSGAGARPQPRAFVPPAAARPGPGTPESFAAAPEVASAQTLSASLSRLPRAFLPPPGRPAIPGAPPRISTEAPVARLTSPVAAEATLAIVGLNPARTTDVPPPPGSRAANFSAGPEIRPEGGAGGSSITMLNVPGLIVKGGPKDTQPTLMAPFSPTSKENLLAAARIARSLPPKAPEEALAPRVAEAPDPRLAGRVVYTVAIQMPNITSFSGSWLVWFAEREPVAHAAPPQIRPPVPLRKVDPKYIAAAAADRVEGKIRLFGVIRKDGHVDGITLLLHLDDRLDASAREALAKWQFEPALRNGSAVDVDAVFEIPFHLAPRPK